MTVGNLTIQANVQGAPTGSRSINSVIPLNSAVDATQVITLSIGANTITVPTGATECIIYGPNSVNPTPNPVNAAVLTLEGVAGDTGVVLSGKYPTVLSWDTAPASFVINSTATGTLEAWFA